MTTLFAPTTQRSPIVTPLVTTTFAPSQTLSPIRVGPLESKPCQGTGRSGSSKRWLASVTKHPLASMQCAPISTSSSAATITAMFRNVPSPIRTLRLVADGDPHVRLEHRVLADLEPAVLAAPPARSRAGASARTPPAASAPSGSGPGSTAASCARTTATSAPRACACPRKIVHAPQATSWQHPVTARRAAAAAPRLRLMALVLWVVFAPVAIGLVEWAGICAVGARQLATPGTCSCAGSDRC